MYFLLRTSYYPGIHMTQGVLQCPLPTLAVSVVTALGRQPGRKIARVCSVRYRYSRYRYGCRTELTEVSVTSIDVAPNFPKCPVPVVMYRNYRSVRYRYESLYRYRRYGYPCRTDLTELSGTGIDVVPNLPKCPVPVLISYRTYRSVWYRC